MRFIQVRGLLCRLPIALAVLALAGWQQVASAQMAWPAKPVRLVVPIPAGGSIDRVFRSVALSLQQELGQPVVVDYKPGANGNIGAADVANNGGDGYSWLIGPDTILTINPFVYKSLGFKQDELEPLNLVGGFAQVLVCNPKVGVKSVADLKAKAVGSKMTYASGGAGSPGHLATEMFLKATGIAMTHVPYRGPAPAVQDLVAGHVDCGFIVGGIISEYVKAGSLIAIASSSKKRSVLLPDVPAVSEVGVPDFDATFWVSVFGARNAPPDIKQKLVSALAVALRKPEVARALAENDYVPGNTTVERTKQEFERNARRWADVTRSLNLQVN
jgi:tripartite-type tricarboxylate transporter receptor subunit TctC